MKKNIYWYIILGLFLLIVPFATPLYAQEEDWGEAEEDGERDLGLGSGEWAFDMNPVKLLETVKMNANKNKSEEVQNTEYDYITSSACDSIQPQFTISKTLCNIKVRSRDYIQYIISVGLTAATIFLIWNGFKIVTSSDREKQFGIFKKNFLYTVIGVFLLIGFYYIIDIFVSIINVITRK